MPDHGRRPLAALALLVLAVLTTTPGMLQAQASRINPDPQAWGRFAWDVERLPHGTSGRIEQAVSLGDEVLVVERYEATRKDGKVSRLLVRDEIPLGAVDLEALRVLDHSAGSEDRELEVPCISRRLCARHSVDGTERWWVNIRFEREAVMLAFRADLEYRIAAAPKLDMKNFAPFMGPGTGPSPCRVGAEDIVSGLGHSWRLTTRPCLRNDGSLTHTFRLVVPSAAQYRIRVQSKAFDPYFLAQDERDWVVMADDNSGNGTTALAERRLGRGTYYITVGSRSGAPDWYSIFVDSVRQVVSASAPRPGSASRGTASSSPSSPGTASRGAVRPTPTRPTSATTPTATGSASSSSPVSTTSAPSTHSTTDSGQQPASASAGAGPAAAKPLRWVFTVGMSNLPGDTMNPTCYSNIITRPGPPGWGGRGFLPTQSAKQRDETIKALRQQFVTACEAAAKGRTVLSMDHVGWQTNQIASDEERLASMVAKGREDVTVRIR